MKKNFLFGLLALMLAGFGFGGVSMADDVDVSSNIGAKSNSIVSTYYNKFHQYDVIIVPGTSLSLSSPWTTTADLDTDNFYQEIGDVSGLEENLSTISINSTNYDSNVKWFSIGMSAFIGAPVWTIKENKLYVAVPWLISESMPNTSTEIKIGDKTFNVTVFESESANDLSISSYWGSTSAAHMEKLNVNNDGIIEIVTTQCNYILGIVVKDGTNYITNSSDVVYRLAPDGSMGLTPPSTDNGKTFTYDLYPLPYSNGICPNGTENVDTTTYKLSIPGKGTIQLKFKATVGSRVSFNTNGGSEIEEQVISLYGDGKVTKPNENPTKEGQAFAGWYKEVGCTNAWDFNSDIVTSDTVLYAKWAEPVAKIGDTNYATLDEAIAVGGDIEILKAGEYTLPTTINNDTTIGKADSVEGVVTLKIDGSSIGDGEALITLGGNLTIEGATINLVNVGSNWEHLGDATHKITMEKCIINGELYVRGDMDFKECTFNGQGKYQIHINYGNVNFDTCTFTNNVSRHINIAWGGDATYKINFKDSTFSNTEGAASKAAVMIHELWNQSQYSATNNPSYYRGISEDKLININGTKYIPGKWEVTFENTNVTDGSIFSDKYIGNNQLWGIDTLYASKNDEYVEHFGTDDELDPSKVDEATLSSVILGSSNGGEVKVKLDGSQVYTTPKKGVSQWTVTFDGKNALIVNNGEKAVKPTDPADQGCSKHFVEWRLNGTTYDFNTTVTSDLALTSYWTSTCSSGGGGGGSSKTYSCKNLPDNAVKNNSTSPKSDTNYSYSTDTSKVCTFQCKSGYTWNSKDAKCEKSDANTNTGDTAKLDEPKNENEDNNNNNEGNNNGDNNNGGSNDGSSSTDKGFSQEFKDAYAFAHENGITTKNSIEEADMYGPLTRIAMAKMLSQYAINVLGKTPDTTKVVPTFPDVSAQLDADYNNGVTLAYQLGIMGIGIEEFRPFDLVTRAEFGTALSRMLYGTADGEGNEWYSTHLEKLMNEKIITNDNPQLQELRGYVMIMLMRSAQ